MIPNGVLFENEEFEDYYLPVNLPVDAPLVANYYSNGIPVTVTSNTGYNVVTLPGTQIEQFTGVNADGERTCSVEITQLGAFSTGLLQHQCGGVNGMIITPPVRPPDPVDPWSVVKWEVKPSPGAEGLVRVTFSDGNFLTTGPGYSRVYRTSNGDAGSWQTVKAPAAIPFCQTIVSLAGYILIPAFDNTLYRSTDNGLTFVGVSRIIDDAGFVRMRQARMWEANGWVLLSTSWDRRVGFDVGAVHSAFVTNNGVDLIPINVTGRLVTGFTYKDGIYYIVTSDRSVWSSSDPTTWINNGTLIPTLNLFEIDRVFRVIDGTFVASDGNIILITNDPASGWFVANSSTSSLIREVVKVRSDTYFAITSSFTFKRSSNLVDWEDYPMPYGGVSHAAFGNGVIMCVSNGGNIFTLKDDTV